jgi:hypothetical protein
MVHPKRYLINASFQETLTDGAHHKLLNLILIQVGDLRDLFKGAHPIILRQRKCKFQEGHDSNFLMEGLDVCCEMMLEL